VHGLGICTPSIGEKTRGESAKSLQHVTAAAAAASTGEGVIMGYGSPSL